MADLEQWVNLTPNDKWKGDGLNHRWRMGIWAKLKVKFSKKRRAVAYVTLEPGGDNATYSPTERRQRSGFRMQGYARRRVMTDRNGELELRLGLNLAGGDEWNVKVEDRNGKQVTGHKLMTRRKLYFQVVRMQHATALSGISIGRVKNTFWRPQSKLFVKMIEVSPGATIADRRNYDDTDPAVVSAVATQLRAVYDDQKKPYEFVTMLVRRNGIPDWEQYAVANFNHGGGSFNFPMAHEIFDVVDPAVPWLAYVRWTPAGGGAVQLGQASPQVSRTGLNMVTVNFAGMPAGPGTVEMRVKTVCVNGRGVSIPGNNLTLVASQDAITGAPVSQAEMLAVMTHELGHKIGMVQGGPIDPGLDAGFGSVRPPSARGYLDRQPSYYWARGHQGGHCHTGAALLPSYGVGGIHPTCTMFGDTRSNSPRFCDECRKTIRKLDLRSSTNPGIRTQF